MTIKITKNELKRKLQEFHQSWGQVSLLYSQAVMTGIRENNANNEETVIIGNFRRAYNHVNSLVESLLVPETAEITLSDHDAWMLFTGPGYDAVQQAITTHKASRNTGYAQAVEGAAAPARRKPGPKPKKKVAA